MLSHSGAFALGVRSEISLLPDEQLGMVVLSNAAPSGLPEGMSASFYELVLDGKLSRDWIAVADEMMAEIFEPDYNTDYTTKPSDPQPPLGVNAYVGRYLNDYYGALEIAADHDGLKMRLGPMPLVFQLHHWNRDVYLYQPVSETAGGLSGVIFTVGEDGRASQVVLENLNVERPGTFVRAALD